MYDFKYEHRMPEHCFSVYRNEELIGFVVLRLDGFEAVVEHYLITETVADHVKLNLLRFMENKLYELGISVIYFACPVEDAALYQTKRAYKPLEVLLKRELNSDPNSTRIDEGN